MSQQTVYILGAGAGKEADLPTGEELKNKIVTILGTHNKRHGGHFFQNQDISDALRYNDKKNGRSNLLITPYLEAAQHIREAMPLHISIDNFIDTQRGNDNVELCGKLSIVKAILDAEKNSKLYIDLSNIYNKLDFNSLKDSWYNSFMMLLTENCSKEELVDRFASIAIVIFNYDRCFEHFLYNALQASYRLDKSEAAKLINEIEIYHPYGVVGKLPWQEDNVNSVKYGENIGGGKLYQIAKQIRTFTEGTDPDSSDILTLRKNIEKAKKIVFLGFAYHRLNLELLMEPFMLEKPIKADEIIGTAKSLSASDCSAIKGQISRHCGIDNLSKDTINIKNDLTCLEFFREYWRTLSFA